MEARKEEFRQYLEDTGVISALTKALIKLYEMKYERPASAVEFIQKNLSNDYPSMETYQNLLNELNENKAKLAELLKGGGAADPNTTAETTIEEARDLLQILLDDATCTSLLKQHLTMDLFDLMKDKKTASGKTLIHCINSGLRNPKSKVGVYAADGDAYTVFADLFDEIISAYHAFDANAQHPDVDIGWDGDTTLFQPFDPQLVISTRIRCARSYQNYPLNPAMTEENYLDSMKEVKDVLATLTDKLAGNFLDLEGMDEAIRLQMIDKHQLFKSDDENLKDAGALRHWPKGRGIYLSNDETFLVWVNEEDHLRFISMDQGGDIEKTYNRLMEGVKACAQLQFKKHDRLGWITFCPTNLGSTIRASVMIKLPKLKAAGTLQSLADTHKLQIRGLHGEGSDPTDDTYEISNKRRLGLSEYEAVKEMYDGIQKIIEEENA